MRGIALDCGAEQTVRLVLNQAKSQVGQGDEPAEVILRHDLCGVRVPGVVRHVIDGRVGHKVVHVVAARSRRHKGLLEELVRALNGGEEVQAERRSCSRVAVNDILHKVGGPSLPLKVGERLTLGCGVLDGLDEEHVEVVAAYPAILEDLCAGGCCEVGVVLHRDDEGLLRGDQAGLLDPRAVAPQAVGAIVFAMLGCDGDVW